MKYYSLNKQSPDVDFKEATIRGQAPDKGLYFPHTIPVHERSFFRDIATYSNEEIAYRVIKPYVGETIPEDALRNIVKETIDFPISLVHITDRIASLELYHGPTLAFKDVGARFMSRCLGHFAHERSEKVVVLVATSGDTGGAVAHGFYDVPGVEVVILYPSGKVSAVQEKQLTTLGKNIHALKINGSFDDCQQMVKEAFADTSLRERLFLTSANSINVARWLPQQFYYFFTYKQWRHTDTLPVISVPSGNFGNICAGLLAYCSGLPVQHFIAACNENNVVPSYLNNGLYQPKKPIATLSNAMDVGDPSNFVRVLELFRHQLGDLRKVVTGYSISDEETRQTIRDVYAKHGYLPDPHGAVAYAALKKYLEKYLLQRGVFLETAHPVKFYDTVEKIIGVPVVVPEEIKEAMHLQTHSVQMEAKYEELNSYLYSSITA